MDFLIYVMSFRLKVMSYAPRAMSLHFDIFFVLCYTIFTHLVDLFFPHLSTDCNLTIKLKKSLIWKQIRNF